MKKISAAVVAALLALAPAQAQRVSTTPNNNYIAIPNYTANGGLPHWQACRQAVINGVSDCNVLWIGESTSIGHGSFLNEDGTDAHAGAPANQLALFLRLNGVNAQTNSITGTMNTSAGAAYHVFDTRVTSQGTWADATSFNYSLGGYVWYDPNSGDAFTFNPTDPSFAGLTGVQTDALDVYYLSFNSGGANLTVKQNSTTICTINTTTGSNALVKQTCSGTLGANSYSLSCATAFSCEWQSIVARNSAVKQVSIINAAFDGATVAQYNTNTTCTPPGSQCQWNPLPSIAAYSPKLCIINDIGNDTSGQTALATYQSNLQAIAAACQAAGADVLFMTGFPSELPFSAGSILPEQYASAVQTVAANLHAPVWDTLNAYGSYTSSVSGWYTMGLNAGWNAVIGAGNTPEAAHWSVGSNVYQGFNLAQILLK